MTKEEQYLISHAHDKANECFNKNMLTSTNFLDIHQQTILSKEQFSANTVFYGGFDDAERKILCFLPDYLESPEGLCILTAKHSGYRKLTHRDYLGALMSLGIKRENIGDIITSDKGAQIIIKEEMAEFIIANLSKAGKSSLSLEIKPITELSVSESNFKEIVKTVASMRLDSVVSAIFGISRNLACAYISAGRVFVNSLEALKPDKSVCDGDKITLRSKGKAVITSSEGKSKKGRVILKASLYL